MRLKRGLERGSCDFCYRRKVKCDRSSRIKEGHESCSQCQLRQIHCDVDDSGDIRLQRRRKRDLENRLSDAGMRLRTPQEVEVVRPVSLGSANTEPHSVEFTRDNTFASEGPILFSAYEGSAITSPTLNDLSTRPFPSLDTLPDTQDYSSTYLFSDPLLELSIEGSLFLDQIFMRNAEFPEWETGTTDIPNQIDVAVPNQDDTNELGNGSESFCQALGVDQNTLTHALEGYFRYAAHCLPIILPDAFWEDYHASRCSQALVCAVACCGMPFTTNPDKWNTQQKLARGFRDAFLEAQNTAPSPETIRLDNLEALALMVDFEYENTMGTQLNTNLGNLFLTHDSLNLMTLQYRIQTQHGTASSEAGNLAKAKERRTLLFWHVYGLDSFHTLDKKSLSRIHDQDIDLSDNKLKHDTEGYLDAILSLAILARRIVQALCNARTRRKGIGPEEVTKLYDQLVQWRKQGCPSRLRWEPNELKEIAASSRNSNSNKQSMLHRVVLRLLELNCYMQIEDCVERYGIQSSTPIEAEILSMRVEAESLSAAHQIVKISEHIKQVDAYGAGRYQVSLIDLSPNILRDICAGACFWLCTRAKQVVHKGPPSTLQYKAVLSRACDSKDMELRRQHVESYLEQAALLLEAVKTATSHKDTKRRVEGLTMQIHSVKEMLGGDE